MLENYHQIFNFLFAILFIKIIRTLKSWSTCEWLQWHSSELAALAKMICRTEENRINEKWGEFLIGCHFKSNERMVSMTKTMSTGEQRRRATGKEWIVVSSASSARHWMLLSFLQTCLEWQKRLIYSFAIIFPKPCRRCRSIANAMAAHVSPCEPLFAH